MADSKLTALAAAAALAGADLTYVSQGGVSLKATLTQIKDFILVAGTITASAPVSITQTWNNAGVTFTAFSVNATDSASAGASLLMTLGVAGVPWLSVTKPGGSGLLLGSTAAQGSLVVTNSGGVPVSQLGGLNLLLSSGGQISWESAAQLAGSGDTFLTRGGVAAIHHGAANAASPVAQTVGAQGSRSGTDSNVAGANLTVRAGIGTGNSTGSSLIFQTPLAVASGTGAQTSTTRLTLSPSGVVVAAGQAFLLGNAATTGLTAGVLSALTNASIVITDSAGQAYRIPCII